MQNVILRISKVIYTFTILFFYIYTQSVSYVSGNTYIVVGSLVVPFPYFFSIK